jgi:hypothetical protein
MMPPTASSTPTTTTITATTNNNNNIFIRIPGAHKSYTLSITPETHVHELKAQIAALTGLPAGEQYLMYQSKTLQDAAMLALYDGLLVSSSSSSSVMMPTVEVGIRQRGGCFIVTFTILTILFIATMCAPFTCGTSLLLYVFLLPPVFVLPFFCL